MAKPYLPLALWNYTPVLHSMPALPIDDVCERPLVCVQFSAELVPYLLGLLEIYRWPDKFHGTPEEVQKSLGIIQDLMRILAEGEMCCCDQNTVLHRVTQDGQLQVSYDNGVTWVQDPQDPRLTMPQLPAPVPAGVASDKCNAAANGVAHLKDAQADTASKLGLGLGAIDLALEIIGIIIVIAAAPGTAPILVPVILTLAASIAALTPAAYNALFSQADWDKLLCILYCNIGADGHFTQAGYDAVISDIDAASFSDLLKQAYKGFLVYGVNGLNNMCSYGTATADCSACECPDCLFDYDFRIDPHILSLSAHRGSWVSGQGWESTDLTVDVFNYYTCMVEVTIPDGCTTPFLHWELFYADISGVPGAQVLGKYQFLQDDGTGNIVWIDNGWNNGGATNTEHSTTVGTPGYLGTTFYGVRIQITNLGVNGGSFIRRLQLKATNP